MSKNTNTPAPAQPPSSVIISRGYVIPNRPARYEPVETKDQSIFRKWIVPGTLIAIGLAEWIMTISDRGSMAPFQFTAYATGGILFSGISLILGLLAMAHLMGAELDTLAATAAKLAAIAIFCGATAALVAGIDREIGSIRGVIVALHLVLVLYFLCCTFLFELDLLDGLVAAVISLVIQAGLIMTVAQALPPGAGKLML